MPPDLIPPIPLDLGAALVKMRTRDLFTVREVAEITGLSGVSVRLLIKLGELDGFAYRIGGGEKARRITVSSLCRYLLTSATLSESDRAGILSAFVEKLDPRTIDFLLPRLTDRLTQLCPPLTE